MRTFSLSCQSALTGAAAFVFALMAGSVHAAPEDVAALKGGLLTPYGAERAGNKEGTIPAWDGKAAPGTSSANGKRSDPYAADKPRLVITPANVSEHAAQLTDGTRALLAKVPDFKLEVYPSHRSASFPQVIYDQVLKNASRAKLINDGLTVEGAYGGIPFPVVGADSKLSHRAD